MVQSLLKGLRVLRAFETPPFPVDSALIPVMADEMNSKVCSKAAEALEKYGPGDCSAGAFFSNDFEWESLRAEVEDSPREEYIEGYDEKNSSSIIPEDEASAYEVCRKNTSRSGESVSVNFPPSSWEAFHKSHSKALFFKERRYLVKEFPELLSDRGYPVRVLEVGCGTGSSVVPVLRANKNATVYGCDCSSAALRRATELVTERTEDSVENNESSRFHPFLCDVSSETLPSWLRCSSCRQGEKSDVENLTETSVVRTCRLPLGQRCLGGVDIVTMIFTLSSIPPANMLHVMSEVVSVLQPGGWLLFRDYGLYDLTMLRFPPSQNLSERLYHRKDGTLSYFFSLQFVRDLLTKVGLVEEELNYSCVQLRNRKTQCQMKRVWVHAKFRKAAPIPTPCLIKS